MYSLQETNSVVRWHSNHLFILNTNVSASKKCCRFLLQHWQFAYKSKFKKKEIQIMKTFSFTLKCVVTTVKKTVIVIIIWNIRLVFIQLSSLISSFFQDKDKNRKGEENAKPTKNSNRFISRFGFNSNNIWRLNLFAIKVTIIDLIRKLLPSSHS